MFDSIPATATGLSYLSSNRSPAHIGDVLELTVRNETNAAHPYHLHGFSMQPVRMTDNSGTTLYDWDYDEFLDTIDVQGMQSYVFRVRLDDRPKACDLSPSFPPGRCWRHALIQSAVARRDAGCSIAIS